MRCIVLNDKLFAALRVSLGIIFGENDFKNLSLKGKFRYFKMFPAFGVTKLRLCVVNGSLAPSEFRKFLFEHEKYEIELTRKLKMRRDMAHRLSIVREYQKASQSEKLEKHHAFMLYHLERISFCFPISESALIKEKELRWEIYFQLHC